MKKLILSIFAFVVSFGLLVGCGRREVADENASPHPDAWDTLPPIEPSADDWPWWRGPSFDNRAARPQNPPVHWSQTENVVWKAAVPGRGHGSPCIWGNRIFLATADEAAEIQYLRCYHRQTGEPLWQTEIQRGGFPEKSPRNSHASSTAACDGRRVYIPFLAHGRILLTALDLEGRIIWQTEVGSFVCENGYGASPTLYRSLVIVSGDNEKRGFLAAVHRETGEIIWRTRRPDAPNYATAIVAHVCGRDQLLIPGPFKVTAYDPNTGDPFWSCDGPAEIAVATVAFGDELVYASAGHPKKNLLCIRADGSGDVTGTHLVWERRKHAAYVPSPLLHEGLLYLVNDAGLAMCYEAATGEDLWAQRLDGRFSSSPVAAGGNIYVANEAGTVYVLKMGRKFELVAKNDLDDETFATPAICADRIYLRTLHYLYCLGD